MLAPQHLFVTPFYGRSLLKKGVHGPLLEGSWLVISGAISRATLVITYIRGLITPFISTHEPPSRAPCTPV